ncbi:MAG: DNA polymerase III subunit beta [Bacilli bacterium]
MKFQINKKVLQNNLAYVSKAVFTKTPLAALNGIKFELNEDGLILIGSGLQLTIKAFIPKSVNDKEFINIISTGSMVLNENYITELVKKVDEETIEIELVDNSYAIIKTERGTFKLNCISLEDYPNIDIVKSEDRITFSKSEFKKIISQTVFAASSKENTRILTGVCFDFVGDVINIAATNRYRLSNKFFKTNSSINSKITIPSKNLSDLNSICNEQGDMTMHIFSNKVMFEFDNVVFQSTLLEGDFPNISSIIPKYFEIETEVDSKNLLNTIDRASILSRDKSTNAIKFSLDNKSAIVSSKSKEIGKIEEAISINPIKLGVLQIEVNARFLKDAINAQKSSKVILKFNGDTKPIVVTNPEDNSLIQLVVPIKVNN